MRQRASKPRRGVLTPVLAPYAANGTTPRSKRDHINFGRLRSACQKRLADRFPAQLRAMLRQTARMFRSSAYRTMGSIFRYCLSFNEMKTLEAAN